MTTDEKIDLILQHIQKQDKRADAQDRRFAEQNKKFDHQNKILEAFHTDIEWLKQNSVTKKDLTEALITEREHTRQIIHEEINLNNKIFSTILKVELAEMKQDIKTILQNHETRIQTLEERTLSKPNQN